MTDRKTIDANALLEDINYWYNRIGETMNPADMIRRDVLSSVMDGINEAPTIDVVKVDGNTSDGYHTFNELYDHRAKLFSVIVSVFRDRCWKSKRHHDGTMYDGMFIVGINTPNGQASYHYALDPYWEMFDCEELDNAPEWDGHTPKQAIDRIAAMRKHADVVQVVHARWIEDRTNIVCSACKAEYSDEIVFMNRDFECEDLQYCPNCGAKMDGGVEE